MAITAPVLKEYMGLPPDIVTITGGAVDDKTFIAAVGDGGEYVFTKDGSDWKLNGDIVVLSEYGVTAANDAKTITVEYTTTDVDVYINAAKSKTRAAGIPEYQNNAQYDMFILALATLYYDNRGFTYGGTYQSAVEENARNMINAFVLELRYAKEDDDG